MPFRLNRARELMLLSSRANPTIPPSRLRVNDVSLFGGAFHQPSKKEFRSASGFPSDTEGFLADNRRGAIVLSFRGSEGSPVSNLGFVDWVLTDFLANFVPYPPDINAIPATDRRLATNILGALAEFSFPDRPMFVHPGFLIAYLSVRTEVLRRVKATIRSNDAAGLATRILTTGHSLGGALAEHAAIDLAVQFRDADVRCYTFGAHRIGNANFNQHANNVINELYHVINHKDPIPFTPPVSPHSFGVNLGVPPLRYQRSGTAWYIKKNGRIREGVPAGTVATNFSNHFPASYLTAINATRFA